MGIARFDREPSCVPIVIDIVNATDELLLQRHYAEKQEWKQTQ